MRAVHGCWLPDAVVGTGSVCEVREGRGCGDGVDMLAVYVLIISLKLVHVNLRRTTYLGQHGHGRIIKIPFFYPQRRKVRGGAATMHGAQGRGWVVKFNAASSSSGAEGHEKRQCLSSGHYQAVSDDTRQSPACSIIPQQYSR